jgi:NTE family protein
MTKKETGLCLSGGGYRAMLFHTGSVLRQAELGMYGAEGLPNCGPLTKLASASGGSMTAGILGISYRDGVFEPEIFEKEIRKLAGHTLVDTAKILGGLVDGGVNRSVARQLDELIFQKATLQDLPDTPNIVICATSLQSLVMWRFSKARCGDYRVGYVEKPDVRLGTAVAASAAYPPYLSPAQLEFHHRDFKPGSGKDLDLPKYHHHIQLTDGGVYDNLALEPVWESTQTVLVSDGSGVYEPKPKVDSNWLAQTSRANSVADRQVVSLRKRMLLDRLVNGELQGAYWSIRSDIEDYSASGKLACPHAQTLKLAGVETDLESKSKKLQERLINWGYAICDAALRTYVVPDAEPPLAFPYPDAGVG